MKTAKFTFDTIFDGNAADAVQPMTPRQRRTLMQAEIDAMLADARAEGQRASEVKAQEAIAAGARAVQQTIERALTAIRAQSEDIEAQSTAIAIAAARKLGGAALAAFPQAEVERVLREALHQAIGEPRLVVRANTAVIAALSNHIGDIAHDEGFDGRVQLAADDHFSGADCRIEWRGGGAERMTETIEHALDTVFTRRFSDAPALED
ncbi:MAG: hypothetical protein GC166_01125 [Alphaproteobacteria bacterium]|nr:hypothetical protein [Alphaproteobacteria bacterium]